MNLLALITFVPFGLFTRRRPRRRVAAGRQSLAAVPSAIGASSGGFCCSDCAAAQLQGRMEWGTRCSPCGQPKPAIVSCGPLTYDEPAIDALVARCCDLGVVSLQPVVMRVLTMLYPHTPDGQPIPWAQVDERWASCLASLAVLVGARVTLLLAHREYLARAQAWEASNMPVRSMQEAAPVYFGGDVP